MQSLEVEFSAYSSEQLAEASGPELLRAERTYYAGAQSVLTLMRQGVKAADLQQEIALWARARVGRPVSTTR